MDATTMPLTPSLISKLSADFSNVTFAIGDQFAWSPDKTTVFYVDDDPSADQLILHELSHALLDHRAYSMDIELVSMEVEAWQKAHQLATTYGVDIAEEIEQKHLETYREWMHARSTCPNCQAVGYQQSSDTYRCPACQQLWRVNEARICGLKRYKI